MLASLLLVAGAFAAQDDIRGKGRSGKYRGLDRNNDGRISREEWRGSARSFSAHDLNGDGYLSGNEIQPALDEEKYDDFSTIDGNRDGMVTRGEWTWSADEFNRLDDNHDGQLTRQEYVSERSAGADAGPQHFPTPSSPQAAVPTTPKPPATDRYARFKQLDRDGDGLISRSEWDGDKKSFDQLDANDNGKLNREEFTRTTPAQSKAMFKRYDINGNGTISKTEWRGDKQSFDRLDGNRDGKVEHEEFDRRLRTLEQNFGEQDRDHDGLLSREEWRGDRKAFDRLDDNHDGRISLEEFVGVG
jgi:Ca2+-binding EF-hand superfamily protein